MIKLLELPATENLSQFAAFLWKHRIRHRITHFEDAQQLWLADAEDAEFVIEHFKRWRGGDGLAPSVERPQISSRARLSLAWFLSPVTLSLIGLSLLLTLLSGFGDNQQWLHLFTFVDFAFKGEYLRYQSLESLLQGGQYWRLLTPIFIHFSLMHLVFNLLWTWELGRRVELVQGRRRLLWLALVIGVVSNFAQFMMTGPLFGGLSGVIFGLMGYTWLWDRLNPGQRFGMPPALMTFMMIWLVLGISGLIERLGFGSIANTAHLVGLLSGLVCVLPAMLLNRKMRRSDRC
ncbi:MAG: rhomboid family intramembrane serine protease [Motiliproteus sp.]